MNATYPPFLLEFDATISQEEHSSPLAKEPYTVHCRFSLQTTIQYRDMVPSRIRPSDPVVFVPILKIRKTYELTFGAVPLSHNVAVQLVKRTKSNPCIYSKGTEAGIRQLKLKVYIV